MPGKPPKPQSAKDRLALISHHFLSSDDEGSTIEEPQQTSIKEIYTLALLSIENNGIEIPTFELCKSLATRERSSAIINTTANKSIISFDAQQAITVHHGVHHKALEDVTHQLNDQPHDVYFLQVDKPESSRLSLVNRVLVTAPASAAGMEHTYACIKQLLAYHNTIQIGVTITETSDANIAEKYFYKLARVVRHFLDSDIESYGYLPTISSSNELNTIAEIISTEISEWQQRKNKKLAPNILSRVFRGGKTALSKEEAVYFENV